MNTPRTRPPKRYRAKIDDTPEGHYISGIANTVMGGKIGFLITYWPHIEEHMVFVFRDLIAAPDHMTARLMFRSIINQSARISVMRTLLEKSPHHKDKTILFDELIDEFSALNSLRNKYAHGLWYTLENDDKTFARVFIEEETDTAYAFLQKREVTDTEIVTVTERFIGFLGRVLDYRRRMGLANALQASRQKPVQQENSDSHEGLPPEAS